MEKLFWSQVAWQDLQGEFEYLLLNLISVLSDTF